MLYYYIIITILLAGSALNRSKLSYNLGGNIDGYGSIKDGRLASTIMGAIPLFLILSLKSVNVGVDMVSYIYRFENAREMMTLFSTSSEMGFNFYNLFLHKIGLTWQLYLMTCSVILMAGWISFIHKYSIDTYYSYFIYVTIGLFTMNMSGLRQSMAIAMCLIALVIYENNYQIKKVKALIIFILMVLFTATFHNSALIYIIVPIFFRYRLTKKQCFMLIFFSSAAIIYKNLVTGIIPSLEGTRYSDFTFEENYAINPLVIIFTIVIPLISLYFIPTEGDSRYSKKHSLMFFFSSLNIFFTILSINNNQIGRVAYYFQPCYLVLLPSILAQMNLRNNSLVHIAMSVICIIYFVMGTIGGTLNIDNYSFFWQ